jgi:hypothetical protein
MRIASASSRKRITESVGPKISSCAIRMRGSTSPKIVGR